MGKYWIDVYKDGYTVNDTYDFNVDQGHYKGSLHPFALFRQGMNVFGPKSTDPDSTKNKFKITRKVNHW